jgi:hypothetical protein
MVGSDGEICNAVVWCCEGQESGVLVVLVDWRERERERELMCIMMLMKRRLVSSSSFGFSCVSERIIVNMLRRKRRRRSGDSSLFQALSSGMQE